MPRRSVHATRGETGWFAHNGQEFLVVLGTPEHRNLLANGAQPIASPSAEEADADRELDELTVKELRQLADERGIDHAGLKKAELVAALETPENGDGDGDQTLGEGEAS